METAETQPNSASTAGLEASLSSLNSNEHDANADTQPSKWTGSSTNTSFTASPLASRDPSPARPMAKTTAGRTSRPSAGALSRASSVHDPSPTRAKSSTVRSSTSRPQLTAATTPVLPLPPSSDPSQGAPQPRKPAVESSSTSPRWPVSPRLKSPPPPPSLIKPALPQPQLARKHEPETPVINIQRSTPSPHPRSSEPSSQAPSDTDGEEYAQLPSGMRTPAPGPSGTSSSLETVQEVSQPNTPGPNLDMAIEKLSAASGANEAASKSDPAVHKKNGGNSESGSDSGSVKLNTRRSSSVAPAPSLHSRQSSTTLKFSKGHTTGETSSKHITVEEEEVDSIPRVSLGLNPAGPSVNASLKTKQSTETIRPKKEKKKTSRKQPPTGTASSKADIFEAKVASAVEEADSSDSDETFVYDSNPPDVSDRPRRYHSRTPSATSMVSQLDRNGLRSLHGLMDSSSTGPNPAVKRSMKFANTYTSNGVDTFTLDEDGKGTGRSNAGSARATGRHHHAGRWGRNAGAGSHLSLFDNESPFPNAARSKLSGSASRQSSNPPSPRFPPPPRSVASNGNAKRQMAMVGRYDIDDTTTGADDERTPLLNVNHPNRSIRSTRSRRTRESRDLEAARAYRPRPSFLNRFASCLVLTVMLLLVITGAIGFMFATSQPLTHMELVKISNVLASEQELMMDITVRAHNPNIVVVSVDAADLEIFAKSPHAGTDSEWWRRPQGDDFEILDDPPNDPPPDMDKPSNHSAPNMRLGNVVTIDSPLNFEGSFFRAGNSMASAELRLARPGNDTDGGSERWERIIGDEFTLIVKGVLKYTLPLSQRIRSATVTAQTLVTPNSANDPTLRPPNGTNTEIGIS